MVIGIILIFVGMMLACITWGLKNGYLILGSIAFMVAGCLIGTGTSPSRDAPNGVPAMVAMGIFACILGVALFVAGINAVKKAIEEAADIQNRKNNGDLTTISPKVQQYAKMYRLASPSLFSRAYNMTASRMLSASLNENNSALMAETEGALFVNKEREYREEYPINVSSIRDLVSAMKMIDSWASEYYPPYQINEKLTPVLANALSNANDVTNMKNSMSNILTKFDKTYSSAIQGREERYEITEKEAQLKRKNIQTTGLDYGIITNSAANMALYDSLNAREHEKQEVRQRYEASKVNNIAHSSAGSTACNRIMQAQQTYIRDLKQIVKSVYSGTAR